MPLLSLVATATLLLLAGEASQQAAPSPGSLRWVRAVVYATSPTSVTLRMRDREMTLDLDTATQIIQPGSAAGAALPVGTLVEAHYTERDDVRRAAFVIVTSPFAAVSKRPGRSYRGVVRAVKRFTLSLRVERRNRSIDLDRRTTLTTADGQSIASGSRAIRGQLSPGEEALVIYEQESNDIVAGDMTIYGTSDRALEIRRLESSAPSK